MSEANEIERMFRRADVPLAWSRDIFSRWCLGTSIGTFVFDARDELLEVQVPEAEDVELTPSPKAESAVEILTRLRSQAPPDQWCRFDQALRALEDL